MLLKQLALIKGKFILSSYPSDLLAAYTKLYNRRTKKIEQLVSVNNVGGAGKQKKKVEVITRNFILEAEKPQTKAGSKV